VRSSPAAAEVARAAFALPVVVSLDALLRTVGLARTQRMLGTAFPLRRRPAPPDPGTDPRALAVVRAVDRAGRVYRPGGICLRRSLALWVWLRRRGVDAQVEIGVRKDDDGAMVGHAWVTHGGTPLYETDGVALRHVSFGTDLSIRRFR
jgi:hypothetical protein